MKLAFFKNISVWMLFVALTGMCYAVTSEITVQSSSADFLEGETEDVIVKSVGSIELARESSEIDLGDLVEDVWMINAIVSDSKGTVYLGTSPNGDIIKYSDGQTTTIYPLPSEESDISDEQAEVDDPNGVAAAQPFKNEHVFAMAIDKSDRLIAAISGDDCKLLKFDRNGKFKAIFQEEEVSYIFAITIGPDGSMYLATGPEGKIYKTNSSGKNAKVVFEGKEKNIISLAMGPEGYLYAGSDKRGVIYKIDTETHKTTVMFDAEQTEITSILLDSEGNLFAAATSAEIKAASSKSESISSAALPGRPEKSKSKASDKSESSTSLKIANIGKKGGSSGESMTEQPPRGKPTKDASYVYKINQQGFVVGVFDEKAVFFSMVQQDKKIVVGTGNNAKLFSVDPVTEEKSVIYEDKSASQITALSVVGDSMYLGTANPAKFIKLESLFAKKGMYTSELIDAGQPSMWGKLQIDANIPKGCKVMVSAHSGNINDPNDPTFSEWSAAVEITEPVQLDCPVGRFCQYRLELFSEDGTETPTIREVAVAHVVGNLPPRVNFVKALRSGSKEKPGQFQVNFNASDANKDKLTYEIGFRRVDRAMWIELEDDLDTNSYAWDTRTVEDGRYEIRVVADDSKSNTAATTLTGSRVSDPFVVDNTAPVIEKSVRTIEGDAATIKLSVRDEFTVVGKVSYTVDSNEDFISTLPDDLIYDTTYEEFTITVEDLEPGEHVVAVKVSDDVGNTAYKTFDVFVAQ